MGMIKQYLRDADGTRIGVMVADLRDSKLCFGWSVVHPNDVFDKQKGNMIALNRLNSDKHDKELIVPEIMFEDMTNFMLRAQKYFQTSTDKYLIDGFMLSVNVNHSEGHLKHVAAKCACGGFCEDDCCDETEVPDNVTEFRL